MFGVKGMSTDGKMTFVQGGRLSRAIGRWVHVAATYDGTTAKLYLKSRQDLNRYDCILMLPWGVFEIENDGRRANNKWLQLKFQSLLEGLAYRLIERQKIYWVPKEAMTVNDRVNLVFDWLEK